MNPSVLWFRRDLRLADHPALAEAAGRGPVVGLFVLDPALLRPAGAARVAFLYRCLRSLDESLGGRLVVRTGDPVEVVPQVAFEADAGTVLVSADFGPYGRRRDHDVAGALRAAGRRLTGIGSPYAVDPGRTVKTDGTPFRVFSPFYRADQDYAELSELSDFIKVVAYNNCAGPRFHHWVHAIAGSLFADLPADQVYRLLLGLLNYDETELKQLPRTGFSAEYVRREAARARASAGPDTRIYPGIDIDIPVGHTQEAAADRAKRFESVTGLNTDTSTGDDLTRCTPASVRAAVVAAFEGGADGVVLSRKYSEMFLPNLSGVGQALDDLSLR